MAAGAELPHLTFTLRRAASGRTVDFTGPGNDEFDWEGDLGSLLFEAMLRPVAHRVRGRTFVDTLWLRHGTPPSRNPALGDTVAGDTVSIHRIRRGRVVGTLRRDSVRWLRIEATGWDSVVRVRYVDPFFHRTRMEVVLTGPSRESYLFDPATGRTDSLEQHLEWRGWADYHTPGGPLIRVHGRWDAVRHAAWRPDHRQEASARFAFAAEHGWSPADSSSLFPPVIQGLVDRGLRGDSVAADSLFRLRAEAGTLRERALLEQAIPWLTSPPGVPGTFLRMLLRRYRGSDHFITSQVYHLAAYHGEPIDTLAARVATDIFGSIPRQRERGLDRQEAFPALMSWFERAEAVTPDAAEIFGAAAEMADDPDARDLFWLAAYRGSPAAYCDIVRARAAATGFGPIVRAYVEGDPSLTNWSWGMDSGLVARERVDTLPPLSAEWQRHRQHASGMGGYWRASRFREWLAAHQPDGAGFLRHRFATEPDPEGRMIWARYLLQLGDLSPVSEIRAASESADSATSASALSLMERWEWSHLFADTLRDGPELADLQDLLLRYALHDGPVVTASGDTAIPFPAHDERPDLKLLASGGISRAILESPEWTSRFEILADSALQSRGDREGLIMAYGISPVTRIGKRYLVSVFLWPWTRPGGSCLCGGSSMFRFIRENGRWVVLDVWGVVS